MNKSHRICLLVAWTCLLLPTDRSTAAEPLHTRIDRAIADAHFGPLAKLASDEEFLRRIYLDLAGRTPSVEELRSFVINDQPAKREARVDALLQSEEFDQHFVRVLDIMFMERRGGVRIPQQQWTNFLNVAVSENWSFDKIVREIIAADGTGQHRGAAKFLIQREVEANALTRDIGRIFFGRDLQCAQCHDHPNITDYEQSEYYGIYAFVNRSYLFEDEADNKKSYVGEKAIGDAEFKSVFEPDTDNTRASPSLLDGLTLDLETPITGDDAYLVAPSKKAASVPKFSRRAQLARLITHPDNQHFAKNAVNRFWAHMMGRGLVHPADFHHSENPPSHPGLLQTLADTFVASGFDYRELLRQIALSDTYQRSIDFPPHPPAALAELESRSQQLKTMLTESKSDDHRLLVEQRLRDRRQTLAEADSNIDAVIKQLAERKKSQASVRDAITKFDKQLAANQNQVTALEGAVGAAKKVSELTPDDKALAASLADYQQRAANAKQAVNATKAELDKKNKENGDLANQLRQQQLQLAKLQGQRVGLADMVAEARGALSVIQLAEQRRAARHAELKRQLAALDLHRDALQKQQAVAALADQKIQLAAAIAPLQQERAKLVALTKPIEAAVAQQQQQLTGFQQKFTSGTAALDQQQQTLVGLSEAIVKAESAATDLEDDQIQSAVNVLKEKQVSLGNQVAEAKQQLAERQTALQSLEAQLTEQLAKRTQLTQQLTQLDAKIGGHEAELAAADQNWRAAVAAAELAQGRLGQSWERRYAVRSLVSLSPEQLAGATITALELHPRFRREAEAEWQKKYKDKKPEEIEAANKRKQQELSAMFKKRVNAVANVYVSLFAAPGGSPQDVFSATADQALFMANDGRFQSWLAPSQGTLLHRLQSISDHQQLSEELYNAIHSRSATDDEQQQVAEYLAARPEHRNEAIRELAWGLLSSLEFRFNR